MPLNRIGLRPLIVVATCALLSACNCGGVSSEKEAEEAYLGLDKSVDRAISLGFAGYNASSSANIPPQTGSGDKTGTMTVAGQVDQGSSANKGMRLTVAMTDYADKPGDERPELTFSTDAAALPTLGIQLKDIPNGTVEGSLQGAFLVKGELEGSVTLNLTFAGQMEEIPGQPGKVQRKAGTTTIQGSVTSKNGSYAVNVTK